MKEIAALIHPHINLSASVDSHEFNLKAQQVREDVKDRCAAMAVQCGGHLHGDIDGNIAVSVPPEFAEKIREMKEAVSDEYRVKTTIGVAENFDDAKDALSYALDNKHGGIKVYDDSVVQYKKQFEPEAPTVAESTQDQPVAKAEEESFELDDKTKQQIDGILRSIAANKDYYNDLKNNNPELYAAITQVVNAVAMMVGSAKEHRQRQDINNIAKIIRQAENENKKFLNAQEREVVDSILAAQEEHKQQIAARVKEQWKAHQAKLKVRRAKAKEFKEKNGGDLDFYIKLHSMIGD